MRVTTQLLYCICPLFTEGVLCIGFLIIVTCHGTQISMTPEYWSSTEASFAATKCQYLVGAASFADVVVQHIPHTHTHARSLPRIIEADVEIIPKDAAATGEESM